MSSSNSSNNNDNNQLADLLKRKYNDNAALIQQFLDAINVNNGSGSNTINIQAQSSNSSNTAKQPSAPVNNGYSVGPVHRNQQISSSLTSYHGPVTATQPYAAAYQQPYTNPPPNQQPVYQSPAVVTGPQRQPTFAHPSLAVSKFPEPRQPSGATVGSTQRFKTGGYRLSTAQGAVKKGRGMMVKIGKTNNKVGRGHTVLKGN
jgi:hypothetical protein